ncbi:SMP-30/gluconolactonase/LRE family protein [Steroidobacter sp.]|uniref:SMP-30/gluconolactonase/LRE family protein n=1 Tax=Steroidobacter sp. TaxID=1978227 RepID=UPI001A43160F|nr:SMP-30/gluconolactonase/LRE family protein [Steroidobacter sp.]MBL8270172.1 SMP-30/gluconolactonase/LRE family protein [Steroidobacter sp.]
MSFEIIARSRRDRLGEGLLWSQRQQALFWVDILDRQVHRLSLLTREIYSWDMPEMVGWLIERERRPGFIAGFASGFHELTLDPVRSAPLQALPAHPASNRLNDAKADRHGRIWAGTMPIAADQPAGSLYRLDVDGNVERVDQGYTVANGPAFSIDGNYLYHTDSHAGVIYRFRSHDDGSLSERAVFIEFASDWGSPDGMTVDSEGGLWVAHWGGGRVSRFDEQGKLQRSIELPASQITNCTFAGPNLDRMFVTSAFDGVADQPHAGCLFEVDPQVRGLAPFRYHG